MKKYTKILTVLFLIIPLLFLWGRTYLGGIKENPEISLTGIIFLISIVLFIIGTTWFLYRKEWRDVLGLKTKGITKKIIWKAIGTGLLLGCICIIFIQIVYLFVFKEQLLPLVNKVNNTLIYSLLILILAPLAEELLFRGFIQGLWQKLYRNKEKNPVKLIIVITALLFTISHFEFLFNVTVRQFALTIIFIFILALYMGWLRHKYQSIVPSIFAHFGFNLSNVVAPILWLIMLLVGPAVLLHEANMQIERSQYENDTIPYNFDPNNKDEWKRSYKKFSVLEKQQPPEITKRLRGRATNVVVNFTIDTCGNIYNVHTDPGHDSILYEKFGSGFSEEAVKFIQSLPQCKPYMIDGKKEEKEMWESVFFY